ncbi:MAG: UDP-N-acetylmuramoyl-tripeptide--D-alanyl-D-alanine ligase, partial [Hungatella sp.]
DGLQPGGILFLNGDDPRLKTTTARSGFQTIYFGTGENSDYRAVDIRVEDGYPAFTAVHHAERIPMKLSVMGAHQVLNAMVALAVADTNGVSMQAAAVYLEAFTGFQNRQQIYEDQGMIIIDDTYNASPVSMKAAIDILIGQKKSTRRIAVLADMKELGTETRRFHYEIGTYFKNQPVDIVVTLGDLAKEIARGVKEAAPSILVYPFEEKPQLETWLKEELKAGDCVLFKGSNSMKLGEVVEHVRQYHH